MRSSLWLKRVLPAIGESGSARIGQHLLAHQATSTASALGLGQAGQSAAAAARGKLPPNTDIA